MSRTEDPIVNTNLANGQVSQATGFAAAFGSKTNHSRTLIPNEKVYVTNLFVKKDAVQLELLTVVPQPAISVGAVAKKRYMKCDDGVGEQVVSW